MKNRSYPGKAGTQYFPIDSWQKQTNRAGIRLMTKTNTIIFEKSDNVFHQNEKIPALQLTSKYAQNKYMHFYIYTTTLIECFKIMFL